MLWKFFIGGAIGTASSACYRLNTNVSLALDPPRLDSIMDPAKDVSPIKAVVVGGGYSGSRMAYQLDSMFDVTHIDEKNFFELTNDIIPIIANPWNEEQHMEACRRMMVLHRYYLKRTNVVTGTVDGVDSKKIYLRDGREVPYDLLFVATGERKPFPFRTTQRTISGRVQELKQFNTFLQSCKKVAVVGGGPVGTSIAQDLAAARPELEVHLFHQRPELLPKLPGVCRRHAEEKLRKNDNLHLHLAARVTQVDGFTGTSAGGSPLPLPPPDTSTELQRIAYSSTPSTVMAPRPPSWWRSLFSSSSSSSAVVPLSYAVRYDQLKTFTKQPQSIIDQIYFGKQDDVEVCEEVTGSHVETGFDYVFSMIGDTPRPIIAGRRKPNMLQEHEAADGHYRVSTLFQFFSHPNMFAVGRCTNLPVLRGYGTSDVETRTLFREMSSIVSNPTTVFLHSRDGLQLPRMQIPRQHVRLGADDAVGCTPWSGGMVGVPAVHEFMQDRNFLMKEFQKPIFYKQQDQTKIRQRVTQWMAEEITDVVDFSHC